MYSSEALLDLHKRAHICLQKLLSHCGELSAEQYNRELAGFGYPTVRRQLHHQIGAEEYWISVLLGCMNTADNDAAFPTIRSLEAYRAQVAGTTEAYLSKASTEELNTPRKMETWGYKANKEQVLAPALVFVRTFTHIYHHQGQVVAMCRLLGRPAPVGLDFPIV
jgi:uncharacterized damage-inducible protein DinB